MPNKILLLAQCCFGHCVVLGPLKTYNDLNTSQFTVHCFLLHYVTSFCICGNVRIVFLFVLFEQGDTPKLLSSTDSMNLSYEILTITKYFTMEFITGKPR